MTKQTDDSTTPFNPSSMKVQKKTRRKLDEWHATKVSWATIIERLTIFAVSKGFDVRTATDDWKGEEQG